MSILAAGGSAKNAAQARVSLEIPAGTVTPVLAAVARLGGAAAPPVLHGDIAMLETLLPAARAQDLQRLLPGLTGGEGVAETSFGGYRPLAASAGRAQSSGGR